MTDSSLDVLIQRLDRLERESRRWKAAAASLAVLLVAGAGMGAAAPPPADLQVRSLTIADKAGLPRIRLAADDSKVAQIDLWGPNKRPIVSLYAGPAGGTVHIEGTTSGTAAILSAGAAATLGLHTKTGNASLSLVRETDQPDARLPGTTRVIERASLSLDKGVVRLMLSDTTGTARAVLGDTGLRLVAPDVTEQRQPPSIVLFDEGGKVLWKAP